MKKKAIFFDLDGTLLPMEQGEFTRVYFHGLCGAVSEFGVDPKKIVEYLWAGVGAMVKNDGSCVNIDAFSRGFSAVCDLPLDRFCVLADNFYVTDFNLAKRVTKENPQAKPLIEKLRSKGYTLVLATNPIFPLCAQRTRMSWVGLTPSDFDYVSSYETDRYAKPNPNYYLDLCRRVGVDPSEAIMIGNDVEEDMFAASSAGLDVFLVDDFKIPSKVREYTGDHGSFSDIMKKIESYEI